MDGIEKITAKIAADAQAEIDALTAQAEKEAAEITAGFRAQAETLGRELRAKGEQAASQREERVASVAQLDCRKAELAAKQALLDRAFDRALERLCSLKDGEYTNLLAKLIVQASTTGREEVLFSPADRGRVGAAAVKRANELLAGKAGGQPPAPAPAPAKKGKNGGKQDAGGEKAGKAANAVSSAGAAVKDNTLLTLAEETRPIKGGFILRNGKVEVNCAFETLVRLQRTEMAGEAAKALFGNS